MNLMAKGHPRNLQYHTDLSFSNQLLVQILNKEIHRYQRIELILKIKIQRAAESPNSILKSLQNHLLILKKILTTPAINHIHISKLEEAQIMLNELATKMTTIWVVVIIKNHKKEELTISVSVFIR